MLETVPDLIKHAFEEARPYHVEMARDLALYMNEPMSYTNSVSELRYSGKRSLDPQVLDSIDRLAPIFEQETSKIELKLAPKSNPSSVDAINELEKARQENEELDNESDNIRLAVLHNLTLGTTVSKVIPDIELNRVRAAVLMPTSFAPAPYWTDTDLDGCDYVCHRELHNDDYLKTHFPGAALKENTLRGKNTVDEWWGKKAVAQRHDVKLDKSETADMEDTDLLLIRVVNDHIYDVHTNPLWCDGYPFQVWGHRPSLKPGKPKSFWGASKVSKVAGRAKTYDAFLNLFLSHAEMSKEGRMAARRGIIPDGATWSEAGDILQLDIPNNEPIAHHIMFPNNEGPNPALLQALQILKSAYEESGISESPVLQGRSPSPNSSGKLAEILNSNVFQQITGDLLSMNRFRVARTMAVVKTLQQMGGNSRVELTESARYTAFDAVSPQAEGIPQGIIPRLEVLRILGMNGLMFADPQDEAEFLSLDTSLGIDSNKLVRVALPQPEAGQPANAQAGNN